LPGTLDAVANGALVAAEVERRRRLRLVRQQTLTALLLFCGYAAYYFCRADFSVATPLLIEDFHKYGLSSDDARIRIGTMTSFGVLAYALGKLFLTGLGDFFGGRRSFLAGLAGAAGFTVLFAVGGALPVFTLAWVGNRLTQSIGWAGLIKVSSRWFNWSSYGTVIGVLSVSYLVGDATARQSMGALITRGYGWRAVFLFAAAVACALLVANFFLLRESRVDAGHSEAEVSPRNLFAGQQEQPKNVFALLRPLLFNRAFILVCLLSLGCTIVRETFNAWTPEYLKSHVGLSAGGAASWSSVFPWAGAASVLIAGWVSDRLGANGRSMILMGGLAAASVALWLLAAAPAGISHSTLALSLIVVVALCLLGPYSYLGGAFALEFGGKQAGATSSGIIDGVGYLGGVLAGDTAARIAAAFGWRGVFVALAAVSVVAAVAAAVLHIHQSRQPIGERA
jgi:sugar phosphate permease